MTAHSVGGQPASFLSEPPVDEQVQQLYTADLDLQGYVSNLTRVWAHDAEALALLSYVLRKATDAAGLDPRQRALLVTAAASTFGDSYCSTAFGSKLAALESEPAAASVLAGDDQLLDRADRVLTGWARQVVSAPNGITAADVDRLRTAGYDDRQIFEITLFVALRIAFSMVNDALGAAPDVELATRAPAAVRQAVTFGRAPAL